MSLVTKTKKIEEESFIKIILSQLEKRVFRHIYENWTSSLKYTSIIKDRKNKIYFEKLLRSSISKHSNFEN